MGVRRKIGGGQVVGGTTTCRLRQRNHAENPQFPQQIPAYREITTPGLGSTAWLRAANHKEFPKPQIILTKSMEQRTCPMDFLYHDRWSVLLWPLRWSLGRVSLVSLPPICRPKWAKKKCRTKRHRLSFMFLSSAIAGVIKNQIIDFSRCFLIHAGQDVGVGV